MPLQASWFHEDVKYLLDSLWDSRFSAGDGMTFKAAAWNDAANKVNEVPNPKGAKKTLGELRDRCIDHK